ncbi:hypothetical protein [Flavivirga aquatica]|uniref:hypothetical protein n=1 Tax=Flavivirga aquatica TaxID=1849968 RepID=UPI0013F4C80A|nr:hypothetical protein [Flavivirga aquatica]
MRDLKVLLVLTVLCTGLLTSCTKQELNEEPNLIDKDEIENPRDNKSHKRKEIIFP